jgi:hypothetical protein
MPFHLRRTRDGEGDSGARSEAIEWNEDGTFKRIYCYTPTLGCSMLVGSMSARSYSVQDYWLTTTITEILEEINSDDVHYVRFKTGNSEYEWWNGVYPK